MTIFTIEDELHAEIHGEYETFDLALNEIRKRSIIPWNQAPNVAPCVSWRTCGRHYEIREWNNTTNPWTLIESTPIVKIDAAGIRWEPDFEPTQPER
jgi:hypothetical protein